ncbi:MAG: CD225/dispanin family protein [Muribaculaceae bacterium]
MNSPQNKQELPPPFPPYPQGMPPQIPPCVQPPYQQGFPPLRPKNSMVLSILALLLFFPLGIVAIIKSSKVNKLYAAGDYQGALKASNTAKYLTIYSAIIAFGLAIFYWNGAIPLLINNLIE